MFAFSAGRAVTFGGHAPGPRKRRRLRPAPALQASLSWDRSLGAAAPLVRASGGGLRRPVGSVPQITLRVAAARAGPDDGPRAGPRGGGRNRGGGRRGVRRHDAAGRLAARGSCCLRCSLRWTFRGSFRCPHFVRTRGGCRGGAPRPPLPGLSGVTLQPPVASERKQACPGKAVKSPKSRRRSPGLLGLRGRPGGCEGPGISE